MTPGPTLVYQCPGSGKPLFVESIASGNTFGATFWTDGHMEAPMLPEEPPFVISPHTGQLLWIDDLKLIKVVDWFREETNAENQYPEGMGVGDPPSLSQVLDYLDTNPSLSRQREESIRLYAWRRSNDPVRAEPPGEHIRTPDILANMVKLEQMLTPVNKPDARLLRAEILRELGRFEESLAILKRVRLASRKIARDIIRTLSQRKETTVARLESFKKF